MSAPHDKAGASGDATGPDAGSGAAGFELTEHTADVGLHVWAPDPAGVFEQAALGLCALTCEPAAVVPRETYTVSAETSSTDLGALLVAFLNELLYRIETDEVVFAAFAITDLTNAFVVAGAAGEPVDAVRHRPHLRVKAATYHRLSLGPVGSGWEARVVLDV